MQAPLLQLEFLANYITELSLLEYDMLCYVPSLIAAASIFLAKFILQPARHPWVYIHYLNTSFFQKRYHAYIYLVRIQLAFFFVANMKNHLTLLIKAYAISYTCISVTYPSFAI